ncbi:PqiC family protein [Tropicimonas sp. S265A]|uniref:PqiC family protein n=1 Tax=Tropicimonas sp. S265A TaxID=3415134 RepID=UPI003C7DDACD
MTRLRLLPVLALITLAACAANSDLYLLPDPPATEQIGVRARTIEVRDIVLPSYAAEPDILLQGADTALRPVSGALWAEEPRVGMTQALARRLDLGTTATVAVEPWPLFDGPDLRVQVTVDRVLARADGVFEFGGQYAVTSTSGGAREFLRRFAIQEPLTGTGPDAVADALGRSLTRLSDTIARSIAR